MQENANDNWVCLDAIENLVVYWTFKIATFGESTNILTSFFQNMLAHILDFNNVYQRILVYEQEGKFALIYEEAAKIFKILLEFYPI